MARSGSFVPGSLSALRFPALLLAVAACAGGDTEAGDPFEAPPWRLEPGVRIGSVDDSATSFSFVQAVAVAPDGGVISLHAQEAALRRWTPTGEPAGTIGREGQGPGEFARPYRMGFFGDTLWVMDLDTYRVSYFGSDGAFFGSLSPPWKMGQVSGGQQAESPPRPTAPLRDGSFYSVVPAWSDAIARGTLTRIPHVRTDAEGVVTDTLFVQHFETSDILALIREDRGGTYGSQPFGDGVMIDTRPTADAFVTVDRRVPEAGSSGPANFAVTRIAMSGSDGTAAGDSVFHVEIAYPLVELPAARVDSAAQALGSRFFQFMGQRIEGLSEAGMIDDVRDAIYAPPFVPAVTSVIVTQEGGVWLQRAPVTEDGVEWWVLAPDGTPKGRVYAPPGLRILAVVGDRVWGSETDDLDVPYIVSYDLVRDVS